MVDKLQLRPDSSREEQQMDVEAARNLRSFIAILQEWDRASSGEPEPICGGQLIEAGFTSDRESGMS